GEGRGHGIKIEGAFKTIHVHALTPSPTLPRKRGREQTESAARAASHPGHVMPRASCNAGLRATRGTTHADEAAGGMVAKVAPFWHRCSIVRPPPWVGRNSDAGV